MTIDFNRLDLNKEYIYTTRDGKLETVSKSWGKYLAGAIIWMHGGNSKISDVVETVKNLENPANRQTATNKIGTYFYQKAPEQLRTDVQKIVNDAAFELEASGAPHFEKDIKTYASIALINDLNLIAEGKAPADYQEAFNKEQWKIEKAKDYLQEYSGRLKGFSL